MLQGVLRMNGTRWTSELDHACHFVTIVDDVFCEDQQTATRIGMDKEGLELYLALDTGRGGVLGSHGAPVSN